MTPRRRYWVEEQHLYNQLAAHPTFPWNDSPIVEVVRATDVAALEAENLCDVCGGTGTPASGKPCACRGTGKMSVAALEFRDQLVALTARMTEVERERDKYMQQVLLSEQFRNEDARDHHGDLSMIVQQRDRLQADLTRVVEAATTVLSHFEGPHLICPGWDPDAECPVNMGEAGLKELQQALAALKEGRDEPAKI